VSEPEREGVWWRQPFVWLLIAIPATSVVVGVVFAVISFRTFDGVVVDDYYEQGRMINRVLERDAEAARRGLAASLALDPLTGAIELRLRRSASAEPAPATLRLSLLHATRSGFDHVLDLAAGADGVYRGRVTPLAPGRHDVQLETAAWRLVGSLRAPAESGCELAPAR
jgi:hypothetical protein